MVTVAVNLPDDLAVRLAAAAERRGIGVDEIAAEIVDAGLPRDPAQPDGPGARRRLAFSGVGASTDSLGAARADDMLAEGFGRS